MASNDDMPQWLKIKPTRLERLQEDRAILFVVLLLTNAILLAVGLIQYAADIPASGAGVMIAGVVDLGLLLWIGWTHLEIEQLGRESG